MPLFAIGDQVGTTAFAKLMAASRLSSRAQLDKFFVNGGELNQHRLLPNSSDIIGAL